MPVDHILVIGFGGPGAPEDVEPFLRQVTRGTAIPPARLRDVAQHYKAVGGRSPYHEETQRLVAALGARLRDLGSLQPVFLGMRHWHPFLADIMGEIARQGLRQGLGVVLSPHRSEASFDRYLRSVDDARREAGAGELQYRYLPRWHTHPLFIEAQADQVRRALERLEEPVRARTHLLFSAHSIPIAMAKASRYAQEFRESSRAVARRLGHARWSLAYQSRSGKPQEPWLEPDITAALDEAHQQGARQVVLVPIGFLCDHVEVLFDLDIEGREVAERLGLGYARASTVQDHPRFIEMFAELIQEELRGGEPSAVRTRAASARPQPSRRRT